MFLDLGVGILLGLAFTPYSNTWLNIVVAIGFVLLPDLDAIIYYGSMFSGRGKLDQRLADHRSLLHYPLPYLAIGSIIVTLINPQLLPLFILGGLAHFLHDSIGTGWALPWLIPFNHKRYKLLYQYDLAKANQPQQFLWVWTAAEQKQLMNTYGDPNWHKHTFMPWRHATTWSLFEFGFFMISLIILIKAKH